MKQRGLNKAQRSTSCSLPREVTGQTEIPHMGSQSQNKKMFLSLGSYIQTRADLQIKGRAVMLHCSCGCCEIVRLAYDRLLPSKQVA